MLKVASADVRQKIIGEGEKTTREVFTLQASFVPPCFHR